MNIYKIVLEDTGQTVYSKKHDNGALGVTDKLEEATEVSHDDHVRIMQNLDRPAVCYEMSFDLSQKPEFAIIYPSKD